MGSDESKAQRVVDYLKAHPDAGPKDAASALTKLGVTVSAAYVSTVKQRAKKPARQPELNQRGRRA